MKEGNNNKNKWLNIRLSQKEFDYIKTRYEKTDAKKMSTWARLRLLDETIPVVVRNQSEDDMMAEVIQLKNELKAIGKNFNQAVRRLNAMRQTKEMEHWLVVFEMDKRVIERHYQKIELQIRKMAEKWLQ